MAHEYVNVETAASLGEVKRILQQDALMEQIFQEPIEWMGSKKGMLALSIPLGRPMPNHGLIAEYAEEADYYKDKKPRDLAEGTGFWERAQLREILPTGIGNDTEVVSNLVGAMTPLVGEMLLKEKGWKPEDVDVVITLSSSPPDQYIEGVCKALGIENAHTIEVSASCPTPVRAMQELFDLLKKYPGAKNVLLLGGEILTPKVKPEDLVLFGDRLFGSVFRAGNDAVEEEVDLKVYTPYLDGQTFFEYPEKGPILRIGPTGYSVNGMTDRYGQEFDPALINEDGTYATGVQFKTEVVDDNGHEHIRVKSYYPAPAEADRVGGVSLTMDGGAVTKWILMNGIDWFESVLANTPPIVMPDGMVRQVRFGDLVATVPHQANGPMLERFFEKLYDYVMKGNIKKKIDPRNPDWGADRLPDFVWTHSHIGNIGALTTIEAMMRHGRYGLYNLIAMGAGAAAGGAIVKRFPPKSKLK